MVAVDDRDISQAEIKMMKRMPPGLQLDRAFVIGFNAGWPIPDKEDFWVFGFFRKDHNIWCNSGMSKIRM